MDAGGGVWLDTRVRNCLAVDAGRTRNLRPGCRVLKVEGQVRLPAEIVGMRRNMRIPIVRFPSGTDIDHIDWTDMVSNVPGRAAASRVLPSWRRCSDGYARVG